MTKAVYAGSFDPLTNGHLWVIKEASKLFNKVVVSVGVNPDKKPLFTVEERLEMITEALPVGVTNVQVDSFTNEYLINYAKRMRANYVVRGIRNINDFEFERMMRNVNASIAKTDAITEVYLIPPVYLAEVSSSAVKGLCGPKGWEYVVHDMVPPSVYKKLLQWRAKL